MNDQKTLWDVKLIYIPNGAPLPAECHVNRRRSAPQRDHDQIMALRRQYYENRKKRLQAIVHPTLAEIELENHMKNYKQAIEIIEKAHRDWMKEYHLKYHMDP